MKLSRLIIVLALATTTTSFSSDTRAKMIEEVKLEIKKQGILHPEIVLRQAIWESRWFECTNCSWRYKNMFGFRHKSWITPTNPKGYKEWNSWKESVDYYRRWQAKFYKGGNYYDFLVDRGYSESDKYIDNLKSLRLNR